MKKNHLFLMDPLETVQFEKDTTYDLMRAAHEGGHTMYYLPKNGISSQLGQLSFLVQEVTPLPHPNPGFETKPVITLSESDMDVLWIRTDPPFDERYLTHTWLLDTLATRKKVINHPNGIRTVNEKIWVTQFTDIIPPTLVSQSKAEIKAFIDEHETVILKPTNAFGGQGIAKVTETDTNTDVLIELLTQNESIHIIAQAYIKEAVKGDKRILLLNGEPLGALYRINPNKGHRHNLFAGGVTKPSEITPSDHKIIECLAPHLKKLGLFFVGIDILGDKLIEVNVTSPTCLQEMSGYLGKTLAKEVIYQC
jgi:glutathione synthase